VDHDFHNYISLSLWFYVTLTAISIRNTNINLP
jgi:hypothetical protein